MVKAKPAKRSVTRKVKKSPMRRRSPVVDGDGRIMSHINMVRDPCNSVLGQTAYRGKDGFINRFTGIYSSNLPAATCAVIAYWPRYNRVFQRALAADTDALSINFYDGTFSAAGPGGSFLGTNAGETRPVGACITSSYIGTELDRQGYVVSGVLPYSTVTGTPTLGTLRQLCQRWERTKDSDTETKWIPTASDEEYEQIPATAPATVTDDNIVIHIVCGFAVGKVNFYHRIVNICEWQPYYGLGISCPTPNTPDAPAGLEKVRTALSRMGHWWQEVTHTAGTAIRVGSAAYTSARYLGAATARSLPLLMA